MDEQIERMARWALDNPHDGRPAGCTLIQREFECSMYKAKKASADAKERHEQASTEDPKRGDTFEFRKTKDGNLKTSLTFKAESGLSEEEAFARSLDNPKLNGALDAGGIDLEDFEVVYIKSSDWDVSMKLDQGSDENGNKKAHKPHKMRNYQLTVEWRRKDPDPYTTAVRKCTERLLEYERPEIPNTHSSGDVMCVVGLFDMHFGQYAWAEETGQSQDIPIIKEVGYQAISDLVAETKTMNIDHYLFPVGNDFMHQNDARNETPRSGNRLDVDSRLPLVTTEAETFLIDCINELIEHAPVEVIWIPGNHDKDTSFGIARTMWGYYHNDERVTFDIEAKPHKFHPFGVNLPWLTHGDIAKSKKKQLPNRMMAEANNQGLLKPDMHLEILAGHEHKEGQMQFEGTNTYNGLVYRVLPSLCATNAWAYGEGYFSPHKMMQYILYDRKNGPKSVNTIHADMSIYDK